MRTDVPVRRPPRNRSQRGYILLTLILFIALLVIGAAVLAPVVVFQAKRDREEELIHRGVQYSRAIRAFVKKAGRYPNSLAELDNTGQIRYLRRHYKDPVTGKDFRLLHQGEVQLTTGPGIAGAVPAGGLGGLAGGQATQLQAAQQIAQGLAAGQNAQGNSGTGGTQIFGTPETSTEQPEAPGSAFEVANLPPGQSAPGGAVGAGNGVSGQSSGQSANGQAASGQTPANSSPFTQANGQPAGQTFGGGPIVGVASTSKEKSIRIFNKKDHYKDWQFIYDPSTDRGGLLNTPAQPALQGANQQQPGTGNGQTNNSPFGSSGGINGGINGGNQGGNSGGTFGSPGGSGTFGAPNPSQPTQQSPPTQQ